MLAFLHVANGLYLFAYLVRDILWLRILSVVAMISMLPYYMFFTEEPQIMAIAWQSLFIAVNLVQIALLVMERRPVFLGEEELRVYKRVFSSLTPKEFMKLLSLSDWQRAERGNTLLQQNQPIESLALITSGTASVELDQRHIAEVSSGQFIGEMGFLTQQDASATVIARLPVDYLAWPTERLTRFLSENPEINLKIQGILGLDLVEKLRREGFSSAHPSKMMDIYQKGGLE